VKKDSPDNYNQMYKDNALSSLLQDSRRSPLMLN
jgi:hypothetical protein